MNSAYGAARWGHNPTAVVNAINKQMLQMTLPSRAFQNSQIETYSKQLHGIYHDVLKCSQDELIQTGYKLGGGDAIDFSIKLAMRYGHEVLGINDGEQIIVFAGGDDLFNGRILSALPPARLTEKNEMTFGFGQLKHPNKRLVAFNNIEELNVLFNDPIIKHRICAVLVEPILGEGGVQPASYEFLSKIQEYCNNSGALFIADEVQTTHATGAWSAFKTDNYDGIQPDVAVAAKAISAGVYPLSTISARASVMSIMRPGSDGSTFAASPPAITAGLATMQMINQYKLFDKLNIISRYTWSSLNQLKLTQPEYIQDIRGLGAMLGVEVTSEALAKEIKSMMLTMSDDNYGVDGFAVKFTRGTTLRLSLNSRMTTDDIDYFVNALRQIFIKIDSNVNMKAK